MRRNDTERAALVIRPVWSRVVITGSSSVGLVVLPPFLALYWLTAPTGRWPTVLAIHALTLTAVAVAALRIRCAAVRIDARGIQESRYLGRFAVTPRREIDAVIVVRVLAASSLDTESHLFVLDRAGRTRLRMRGNRWPADALSAVEQALEAPVQRPPAPLTRRELRIGFRPNLDWHERHPRVVATATALLCTAIAAPVFAAINSLI